MEEVTVALHDPVDFVKQVCDPTNKQTVTFDDGKLGAKEFAKCERFYL
jgi:hypothetical protein